MSKKINTDSMNALLSGLIGSSTASSPIGGGETEEGTTSLSEVHPSTGAVRLRKERICSVVETEVMAKVRVISEKEGISIASMINLGLKVILENYEKSHGKVKGKASKRGNIDEVFDI